MRHAAMLVICLSFAIGSVAAEDLNTKSRSLKGTEFWKKIEQSEKAKTDDELRSDLRASFDQCVQSAKHWTKPNIELVELVGESALIALEMRLTERDIEALDKRQALKANSDREGQPKDNAKLDLQLKLKSLQFEFVQLACQMVILREGGRPSDPVQSKSLKDMEQYVQDNTPKLL